MDEDASGLDHCSRCGLPLAGNESFCSHCGRRLESRRMRGGPIAAAVLLLALAAAGTCVYHARRQPPARAPSVGLPAPRVVTMRPSNEERRPS